MMGVIISLLLIWPQKTYGLFMKMYVGVISAVIVYIGELNVRSFVTGDRHKRQVSQQRQGPVLGRIIDQH